MHSAPPSRPTHLTPSVIIGPELRRAFLKHYQITHSASNGGVYPDKRLGIELSAELREQIAGVYRDLRANGFYPDGFYPNGSIWWRTTLLGDVNKMASEDLDPAPRNSGELEALLVVAREKFRSIGSFSDSIGVAA